MFRSRAACSCWERESWVQRVRFVAGSRCRSSFRLFRLRLSRPLGAAFVFESRGRVPEAHYRWFTRDRDGGDVLIGASESVHHETLRCVAVGKTKFDSLQGGGHPQPQALGICLFASPAPEKRVALLLTIPTCKAE